MFSIVRFLFQMVVLGMNVNYDNFSYITTYYCWCMNTLTFNDSFHLMRISLSWCHLIIHAKKQLKNRQIIIAVLLSEKMASCCEILAQCFYMNNHIIVRCASDLTKHTWFSLVDESHCHMETTGSESSQCSIETLLVMTTM